MYKFKEAKGKAQHTVQLMGCGSILREVIAAAELLKNDWDIAADIWSTPSLNELTRDGQDVQRWNLLHPDKKPRKSWVETCLEGSKGPVIAATDYMKMYAEQIRPFISNDYHVLGTDGFGRSDSREALRAHFEVDSRYVAITALKALADQKAKGITNKTVLEAIEKYGIDPDKTNPLNA